MAPFPENRLSKGPSPTLVAPRLMLTMLIHQSWPRMALMAMEAP